MDKLEMVRILRTVKHIPIIAIGEQLEAGELIDLYHSGADAYMEKPIDSRVCAAQANALIDLYFRADEESRKRATLAFGSSLVISPRYRQALIDGKHINLTRKQFDLLLYLAQHRHQVFSTKQLYEQIWNDFFDLGGDNTVTVHINILRKKMGTLGPRVIQTVRGFGYQFIPPPDSEDWTENSMGTFGHIWCCIFREQMLSRPLPSNASVRSRRGMGRRLGQDQIVNTWKVSFSRDTHPEFAPLKQRISPSPNRKLARFIPSANAHVW